MSRFFLLLLLLSLLSKNDFADSSLVAAINLGTQRQWLCRPMSNEVRCSEKKQNKRTTKPESLFFCVPEGDVAGCPSGSDSAGFFSIRSSIVGVDPKEATHIEPRTSRSLFYLRGKFRKKNQTTKKSTKVAMESDHGETTPNGCSTKNQKKKTRPGNIDDGKKISFIIASKRGKHE